MSAFLLLILVLVVPIAIVRERVLHRAPVQASAQLRRRLRLSPRPYRAVGHRPVRSCSLDSQPVCAVPPPRVLPIGCTGSAASGGAGVPSSAAMTTTNPGYLAVLAKYPNFHRRCAQASNRQQLATHGPLGYRALRVAAYQACIARHGVAVARAALQRAHAHRRWHRLEAPIADERRLREALAEGGTHAST